MPPFTGSLLQPDLSFIENALPSCPSAAEQGALAVMTIIAAVILWLFNRYRVSKQLERFRKAVSSLERALEDIMDGDARLMVQPTDAEIALWANMNRVHRGLQQLRHECNTLRRSVFGITLPSIAIDVYALFTRTFVDMWTLGKEINTLKQELEAYELERGRQHRGSLDAAGGSPVIEFALRRRSTSREDGDRRGQSACCQPHQLFMHKSKTHIARDADTRDTRCSGSAPIAA
uniref:Uncharacterized protein n=1 Tax=Mycena chlorophos TaxID=658473 RepID=A0ABQ0KYH1_MYCCL|nr:predicted protein [Mycena chlorophos]